MTTTTDTIKEKPVKNPSYDKSLSARNRLLDFLGAYHLVLHGVKAHEPFDLRYEGKPLEMCDTDDKERFVEFVELIIQDAISKTREDGYVEGYKDAHEEGMEAIKEIRKDF